MSEKERSEQRVEIFPNEIEECTDEELARFERIIMERRGRAAALAIAALIDTVQPSYPRSRCSEISFDIHVYMEENMEGRTDREPELKSSSAGTRLEAL